MGQQLFRAKSCLFLALALLCTIEAHAEGCPTAKDDIATDRPDVTNSSLVVPVGSLQNENGVNFSMRDDARLIDGTNSRWRLGVVPCLEVLVDLPTYVAPLQRSANAAGPLPNNCQAWAKNSPGYAGVSFDCSGGSTLITKSFAILKPICRIMAT